MDDQSPLHQWDPRSDQPARIRDRRAKLRIRLRALPAHLKMLATGVVAVPRVLFRYTTLRSDDQVSTEGFVGLGVNIDRVPQAVPALVRELGVDRLLVRVLLGRLDRLDEYRAFIASLAPAHITVSILQDRAHIENPAEIDSSVRRIFNELGGLAQNFKIGNAVNRTKWGFYSLDEYLHFYRKVQDIRDREYPGIRLTGCSVIDFEMFPILRVLFSGHGCHFDKVASQLYVDRRGAPEHRQMGHFGLRQKIRMIAAALSCSNQKSRRLIISETNWPLEGKGRYAPASGDCCVSESVYADYMVRYYLLALSTGLVETVYWHQLVAEGYGLVDLQAGQPIRRPAYQALKTMILVLKGSVLTDYCLVDGCCHRMTFSREGEVWLAVWSEKPVPFPDVDCREIMDQEGNPLANPPRLLEGKVHYILGVSVCKQKVDGVKAALSGFVVFFWSCLDAVNGTSLLFSQA